MQITLGQNQSTKTCDFFISFFNVVRNIQKNVKRKKILAWGNVTAHINVDCMRIGGYLLLMT